MMECILLCTLTLATPTQQFACFQIFIATCVKLLLSFIANYLKFYVQYENVIIATAQNLF